MWEVDGYNFFSFSLFWLMMKDIMKQNFPLFHNEHKIQDLKIVMSSCSADQN